MDGERAEDFVRQNTALHRPPHVPEIRLHLADEALPLWEKSEEELEAAGLPPPFWAFAWAGGQALARYLIDQPAEVGGRHVLDFASGSGLVAIAACKAGAAGVTACDIDPFCATAARLNAAENDAVFEFRTADLVDTDEGWDVVLAGDVFYERPFAERLAGWFDRISGRGARVLIGDPGRSYLPTHRLTLLGTYDVSVSRALEDAEVKRTHVWCWQKDK